MSVLAQRALRLTRAFIVVSAVLTGGSARAAAQATHATHAGRATDQGRTMIGGGLGGYWSNDEAAADWPSFRQWFAYATPELTYFIHDGFGLGLSLGGMYGVNAPRAGLQVKETQYFTGILANWELRLGPRTGLMVIAKLGYVRSWQRVDWKGSAYDVSAPGQNIQSRTALAALNLEYDRHSVRGSLLLPLVFHASEAVVMGFGPELWSEQWLGEDEGTKRNTVISIGVTSWLGFSF